ncbi:MAG: 16S rRNA (adenine(1518)-N(6)/adenine(1519)-N(6))-dimethyltransferase RsmA [bacterium]
MSPGDGAPPLGQHFLHDPAVIERIVDALQPDGRTVVEIGPGRGALTHLLAERAEHLVAVELDRDLAKALQQDPGLRGVRIEQGDVLARPLSEWAPERAEDESFLLAGNLPYQITSPILFACFDAGPDLERAVLMMQREVAERLVAGPGSRTYGILSVFGSVYTRPELLFRVGSGAFQPPPGVESAVVRLEVRPAPLFDIRRGSEEEDWFRRVVKAAFGQRRKMLRNSLEGGLPVERAEVQEAGEEAGIDLRRRAETLGPGEFALLARALSR